MKRFLVVLMFSFFIFSMEPAMGQCSICTKTAQQLGHKPAKGLNTGIIYLMFAPFAIMGFVGYRFFKMKKPD